MTFGPVGIDEAGADDRPAIDETGTNEWAGISEAEAAEWLESIDDVARRHGGDALGSLLERISERAARHGVTRRRRRHAANGRAPGMTAYVNTIPPERQATFPGDLEVERRLTNLVRWNAMALPDSLEDVVGYDDEVVRTLLEGRNEPLVVAAVDYEIALYRDVSKYEHVLEEGVEGNPEHVPLEKPPRGARTRAPSADRRSAQVDRAVHCRDIPILNATTHDGGDRPMIPHRPSNLSESEDAMNPWSRYAEAARAPARRELRPTAPPQRKPPPPQPPPPKPLRDPPPDPDEVPDKNPPDAPPPRPPKRKLPGRKRSRRAR